ncbi:TetR family transcriptional regulator [Halalkaliarchaeum desulfuricum]|uniref:TetR family transcriptional regulator n=1 Tax=Halalkaliarchaeum desulfuricum TaxID=2055893 RepID=A0A343TJM4_9EURY|nr:TetR/AcrR family transcriptional regulator [Halalkaliarchaeum desulfuricum]AUX09296.1 TetR family transcriptional regulator [Halalkaliarchaeum desulfuricum]
MPETVREFDPLKEEIMDATYRALVTHGYGDLTVQSIADEFDKSKSLLYYHYEDKEDLLAEFLEYALQRFRRDVEIEVDEPEAQLHTLVDRLVPADLEEDSYQVQIALLELRSEAPHNERVREQYTRVDRSLQDVIVGILRRGIDEGVFVDVNPEAEAEILVSLLFGIRTRRLTTDEELSVADTRDALEMHLDRLKADGGN